MATFIFHHIPKCGGTASRQAFRQWFRIVGDYRTDVSPEATARFLREKKDLAGLGEDTLLAGHFEVDGAHLHQRYPDILADDRYRLITFVRDPLELAQSLYFYERAHRDPYPFESLAQRVDSLENYMAGIFPCTETTYRAVLDRYFFIGLTECLQTSFDLLAPRLGKPRLVVPIANALPRDETLTEEEIRRFKQRNALDYKIYAYARHRFEQLRASNA